MRRRQGKVNRWVLTSLMAIAILLFFIVSRSVHTIKSRLYETKVQAAQLSARAFAIVKDYRLSILDFPIDSVNDPNGTGLIGLQFSPLTYGRSDLSDALTTTNPNFSAALVEMLYRLGVRAGDTIGINWDGTFPGLNIQIFAVCKTLGLVPVIVTAQSAGMWGANYPGFTWLELEQCLFNSRLWDFRSQFVTLGGEDDNGRGLPPEARDVLSQIADSFGVRLFTSESIAQAVSKRVEAFAGCRVLITVGLPVTNSGDPLVRLQSKIYLDRHAKAGNALVARFIATGRPAVNIAKPSRIALDYRLPVAPVPQPEIGKGRLFYERRYSVPLALVSAFIIIILLVLVVRYDVEYYFGVRTEDEKAAV